MAFPQTGYALVGSYGRPLHRSIAPPTGNEEDTRQAHHRRRIPTESATDRQWVRPAAVEQLTGAVRLISNVLKHPNGLIRYIDKCFAVVG